jgi:predicted metal-dependent HD superfamily phosphohydrolase
MEEQLENVKSFWGNLSCELKLTSNQHDKIWSIISNNYAEPQRFYHTIEHIGELITLYATVTNFVSDKIAVSLAILFHDVIYDPHSIDNEERSAKLFFESFQDRIDTCVLNKVNDYILCTKTHELKDEFDMDLKIFLDLDMSILGVDRQKYITYCRNIRQEYAFCEISVYCVQRSVILKNFLSCREFIYFNEFLRSKFEKNARENMAWECTVLDNGLMV